MKAMGFSLTLAAMLALAAGCGGPAKVEQQPAPAPTAAPAVASGVGVGSKAPALAGKKWFTSDGNAPDLMGKVYLVDFWFEACPPCMAAVPSINELAVKYADKGLVVVAPSMDPAEQVAKFKESHAIKYNLLSDAEESATAYGVEVFPTLFLVGKDGVVIWRGNEKTGEFHIKLEAALK